jgi:hypothetical protein
MLGSVCQLIILVFCLSVDHTGPCLTGLIILGSVCPLIKLVSVCLPIILLSVCHSVMIGTVCMPAVLVASVRRGTALGSVYQLVIIVQPFQLTMLDSIDHT